MKLTEMLGQYEELLDKKDQLAKDTKDNNAAMRRRNREPVPCKEHQKIQSGKSSIPGCRE